MRFFALVLCLPLILFVVMPWRVSADDTTRNKIRLSVAVMLNVVVVVLVVVPWQRFDSVAHWERIRWIPLFSPPITARDLIGNFLLYFPLGHAVARLTGMRRGVLIAVAAAVLIASCTETLQLFSRGRYPSTTDLLSNSVGAWSGAILARSRMRRARARRDPGVV